MVTLQTLQRTATRVDSVIVVGDGCFLLVYSLLPAARAPALGSTRAGAWGCSALPAVAPALGASGHGVGQLEEAAKTPLGMFIPPERTLVSAVSCQAWLWG